MRTSCDIKEKIIRFRVNDKEEEYLKRKSSQKAMSVSEYMRRLVKKDMDEERRQKGVYNGK